MAAFANNSVIDSYTLTTNFTNLASANAIVDSTNTVYSVAYDIGLTTANSLPDAPNTVFAVQSNIGLASDTGIISAELNDLKGPEKERVIWS